MIILNSSRSWGLISHPLLYDFFLLFYRALELNDKNSRNSEISSFNHNVQSSIEKKSRSEGLRGRCKRDISIFRISMVNRLVKRREIWSIFQNKSTQKLRYVEKKKGQTQDSQNRSFTLY